MDNEIILKVVNELDIRIVIPNGKRVYTIRFHKENNDFWVAMIGNIKNDNNEELISYLLEKVYQDETTNSILNELQVPKNLRIEPLMIFNT
ncbi:hypothetical protein SAMN05192533_12157 [Mesobacillus persicus]|uniref:Uncharacterized protein n=1 Tax=Mesobacillus persicus TaxID=930146 RepID=A0A1H8JKV0_9BACI|nr:hypothetical protein [Mesobacillus persicus]SEN80878.1 hypothetical protein SAMN05192533_12157 [Mesobacillus persicus]